MRTLQQLFNLAIEQGEYREGDFMCNSMKSLYHKGRITLKERGKAIKSLGEFVAPNSTLANKLSDFDCRGLSSMQGSGEYNKVQMRIYQNWSARRQILKAQQKAWAKEAAV